jgi:tRNA(Arg) A34 adenosine deaminase TadA
MDNKFMLLAVKEAKKNLKKMDGGPFGVCLVKNGRVLAVERNTVLSGDATCHAEINAIRAAARKLKSHDLSGCVIYSTTEPCPMCFSAIHWARIGSIVYGTNIADVKKRGFNELSISNQRLKKIGRSRVRIKSGFLKKQCLELLQAWDKVSGKKTY